MEAHEIINWLLDGDISIVYQTQRDLLNLSPKKLQILQNEIENSGWGKKLFSLRNKDGNWAQGPYLPKWTSTHYTLLELKDLAVSPENAKCKESISMLINRYCTRENGINYSVRDRKGDMCINGMMLGAACYFKLEKEMLDNIISYLLENQMKDDGWNCKCFTGAVHSSLHTTLCVLEGFAQYINNGYKSNSSLIKAKMNEGEEFLLRHKLFKSHRTGEIIDFKMTMLSYPGRWRYDILRSLDYFRFAGKPYNERMDDALEIIIKKRRTDGLWPLQHKHTGLVHFDMEKPGKESRWNTLRALRVLNHFNISL